MAQYSQSVVLAWKIAAAEAHAGNLSEIEPAHLLLGLCKLCDLDWDPFFAAQPAVAPAQRREIEAGAEALRQMFQHAGLNQTRFRRRLRTLVARPGLAVVVGGVIHRSQASRRVFQRAEEIAAAEIGQSRLRPDHLLQALLEIPSPPWAGLLAEMGVHNLLEQMFGAGPAPAMAPGAAAPAGAKSRRAITKQVHARPTPYLDRFGRDLTWLALDGKLDPVIGRREEIRSLARALMQKRKSSTILVGKAGVGKTCLVEGLTQRLIGPNTPPALKGRRVVEVSMAGLVAGTKYRGEFEERMQALIRETTEGDDIILFIDEIHTALRAGAAESGAMDAANILKPALARGDFRCIGATTVGDYRRYIEKDPALKRRFQVVWVDEPTHQESVEILRGLRPRFEEHHRLEITDAAIEAAVKLSLRYLPDKAIDLIDQACVSTRLVTLSMCSDLPPTASIGREEVAAVVAQRCRLPVERLTGDEAQRFLRMEKALRRRVIGQDDAVCIVSEAIRAARAGLKDPRRPIGVFLFVGRTGTGKTELARALAEFLFDDEQRLIRLDMSEYMEKHAVSRLVGAPRDTSATTKRGSSPGRCAPILTASCSSTRWRRPIRRS